MKPKEILDLFKAAGRGWSDDKAPRMGAALAYYTVFSLAPLLIIAIGIASASAVFGEQEAREEIVRQIQDTGGKPAAEAIARMLKQTHDSSGATLTTLVGFVVLLFGASGVFVELQDALNTIWKVQPRPGQGLLVLLRDRLVSFTVVLSTGFLLLVSLVVSTALSALNHFFTLTSLAGNASFWQGINSLVTVSFITLLFGLIFKLLPDAPVAWGDVWIGAAVTALLFTAGKYLLGLYLALSSTTSAFGAAGSLVLILLWVYYSSQILLFGAEFTYAYSTRKGSRAAAGGSAVSAAPGPNDGWRRPENERAPAGSSGPTAE
jgi:membrane protein